MLRPGSYFAWLRATDLPLRGVAARQLIAAMPLITDGMTLECNYKLATIAAKAGLSVAVVKRAKRELIDSGLITPIAIDGQASTGQGNAAAFALSIPDNVGRTGAPASRFTTMNGCASEPVDGHEQVRQRTQRGAPVNHNRCAGEPVVERNKEDQRSLQHLSHQAAGVGSADATDPEPEAGEPQPATRLVEQDGELRLVSSLVPPDPPKGDVDRVVATYQPTDHAQTSASRTAARRMLRLVGVEQACDFAEEARHKAKPLAYLVPAAERLASERAGNTASAPPPRQPRRARINAA